MTSANIIKITAFFVGFVALFAGLFALGRLAPSSEDPSQDSAQKAKRSR